MAKAIKTKAARERKRLPRKTVEAVLTEAGYRCAVPTCRGILALDIHHIVAVSDDGGDELSNLLALCPTDHALYHRGTITQDAIYSYKAMLVAIGQAFDTDAIDKLMFLHKTPEDYLALSGDGVLQFARLVAADLASFELKANNAWQLVTYTVKLTDKGKMVIDAWERGDRAGLKKALTA